MEFEQKSKAGEEEFKKRKAEEKKRLKEFPYVKCISDLSVLHFVYYH